MAPFAHQLFKLALLLAILPLYGCGLADDFIRIDYAPMQSVTPVVGYERVGVKVLVIDKRPTKDCVGRKGSEYDFMGKSNILGKIIAQEDLAETISKAIETELTARGFKIKNGAVLVLIELNEFNNFFRGLPEKSVADLFMNVYVKKPNGQVIFSKKLSGQGIYGGGQLRTGANAKFALDDALKDAVSKLFNNPDFPDFTEAIIKAGG